MLKIKIYITRHYYLNFIYRVISNFYFKDGLQRANGLAYVLLMSFVPFFITSASIASLFISPKFYYKLQSIIFADYLPVVGKEIAFYMREFQSHAVGLSIISFLFLFITAISMIITLRSHLDQSLSELQQSGHIGFNIVLAIISFLGFIIIGVILLAMRGIIKHYLPTSFLAQIGVVFSLCQYLTSILAFSIIYKFVPQVKVRTRSAVSAGIVAGILFEFGKFIFAVYIKKFATNHVLYGSLATIPIFLLWLYIISVILLLCVQIMPLLEENSTPESTKVVK